MVALAQALDVGSTLNALARTLDGELLGQDRGLMTVRAPRLDGDDAADEGEAPALLGQADARYEQVGTLGAGGMGQVDAVWDCDLMRHLAIKRLHPELGAEPASLRQFLWEARVTAHLDHPNIVPVHDLGLDAQGQLYFTMKRVGGRSLAALCEVFANADAERFTELDCCARICQVESCEGEDPSIAEFGPRKRRLRLFLDVCQAIAYAHDRGVVHRDLKPANVMVGEFGEVVVMDWGLALPLATEAGAPLVKLLPEVLEDRAASVSGTPRYMAPEQLRGDDPDPRGDVYSLGVMLYELIALRSPYTAEGLPALVRQVSEGELVPLREAAPGVSSSIAAVVAKAMAHDIGDRYASVDELAEDIEALIDGLTPMAEEASALTRMHRYFTSEHNPDAAHLRILDLDLTAAAGLSLGAGVSLWIAMGTWWLPPMLIALALALCVVPLRAYWRVVRSGKRRIQRQLARAAQ